jgi:hypothetical protein
MQKKSHPPISEHVIFFLSKMGGAGEVEGYPDAWEFVFLKKMIKMHVVCHWTPVVTNPVMSDFFLGKEEKKYDLTGGK